MLDFEHIVIPMCYLGCDRLYEKGYLTVEEGTVKVLHNPSHPADLREMLDALDGLPCPGWNSSTEPYFQWHREHHGFT
jgi:hypothetical protein